MTRFVYFVRPLLTQKYSCKKFLIPGLFKGLGMAASTVKASTSSNSPSVQSEATFEQNISIADPVRLSPQVEGRVEPYELVELFYGSNSGSGSPATTKSSQPSPRSLGTSSPEIMQVIDPSKPLNNAYPDSYSCEVCDRVFKEASHYTKHKRGALCRKLAQRLEKQKKKKKISNSNALEKKKSSAGVIEKPYQCNICGAKFCDKVNVELHLERTHSTKKQQWVEIKKSEGYSCTECDRWYQDKESLASHRRKHLSSNQQQQQQQQEQQQQQQQVNHIQPAEIVTSNTDASNFNISPINFQCNICGAKFCDRINIQFHLELTHGTKQKKWVEIAKNGGFSCAECGRWFHDKTNMAAHQRQHLLSSNQQQQQPNHNQSVESMPSNNGPVSFNNTSIISTPVIASQPTSSLNYRAPNSSRSSTVEIASSSSNGNVRTNNPSTTTTTHNSSQPTTAMYYRGNDVEKPYECKICGTKFCDKGNIEIHLERNHGNKQQQWMELTKSSGFSCGECGRWFQNKVALATHQRQHLLSSDQQRQQPNHNQSVERMSSNNGSVSFSNTSITSAPVIASKPTSSMNYRAPNSSRSSTTTSTAVIGSQPAPTMYHQQPPLQLYPQPMQHPHQPPHLPAPLPPAIPPMAHMHNAMPTILHTPQMPLPGTIIPATQNIANQMPVISSGSVQNHAPVTNFVESSSKMVKHIKKEKNETYVEKSKWNICGDCGHKFVDPMNLELHIQRKHPESYMIEKVDLGGGTVLYKTNNTHSNQTFINENGATSSNLRQSNTSSDIPCLSNVNGTSTTSDNSRLINDTNSQNFDCILCGYKATSRDYITSHLKNIHSTSNTNFIHVMENLESNKKGTKGQSRFKKSKTQDPVLREQRHTCEVCKNVFLSKAELIRHRIKDKKYMCGVCCHSSCSQQQMTIHMETHNPVGSSSGSINRNNINGSINNNNDTVSSLTCWFCGTLCDSVPTLDQHLSTHGSLSAECTYCGHKCGTLETLLPHVAIHLSQQSCSIRLTVSQPGQLPVVHIVNVSVDGNVNSIENGNSTNNKASANPNEASGAKEVTTEAASSSTSQLQAAYACSQCGICCAGPVQLEAHLQIHQDTQENSKQGSNLLLSSSVTTSAQSTIITTPASTQAIPTLTNQQSVGLTKNPDTIEFKCEECGFCGIESEPVMRHIQNNHMSGNMLYSIKSPTGSVQVYPIHVVTPISTQETN